MEKASNVDLNGIWGDGNSINVVDVFEWILGQKYLILCESLEWKISEKYVSGKEMKQMDDRERITRQRISEQIRSARSEKGYSLTGLARASGLSVSTIYKIENCAMTPTVMTLLRIVKAVGKDIDFFVAEPDDHKDYVVIRYKEATCTAYEPEKSLIRGLSAKFPNCRLEIHHSRIRRGGSSGKKVLIHNSEEVSICWKGRMKFIIGKKATVLEPLDSIHIKSGVRHQWKNTWNGESEVLFVYSPPLLS